MTLTKIANIAAGAAMMLATLVLAGCGGALNETAAVPHSKAAAQKSEWAAAIRTPAVQQILGQASWYGARFQGRTTASGERFDMNKLTAAHRTLPFGTRVRVTNPANGRSVVVRINDRGPFSGARVIDLSHKAAEAIGLRNQGVGRVRLEVLGST